MNDPKFLVPGRYCGGGGPSRGLGAGVRALFVDSPHRALTSRWPFTGRRPLRQVHCPPLHWREARREADDGRSFQGARRLVPGQQQWLVVPHTPKLPTNRLRRHSTPGLSWQTLTGIPEFGGPCEIKGVSRCHPAPRVESTLWCAPTVYV